MIESQMHREKTSEAAVVADGENLIHFFAVIWLKRTWVAGCTASFIIVAVLYAVLAKPVFSAQAIIALKESGKGSDPSRIFSQLGGLGGMVASQLGIGNASLEKMEILLKGHELAETVIRKHELMSILIPNQKSLNGSKKAKIDSMSVSTIWDGITKLRKKILQVSVDPKKKTITVGAEFGDPVIAKNLVNWYLEELNNRMRNDVLADAEANRRYLEQQLINAADPILIEKIHNMIASEIEKYMLVSTSSFEVLEKAVVPIRKSKPKRARIVIMSAILGIFTSISLIFLYGNIRGFKEAVRTATQAGKTGGALAVDKT